MYSPIVLLFGNYSAGCDSCWRLFSILRPHTRADEELHLAVHNCQPTTGNYQPTAGNLSTAYPPLIHPLSTAVFNYEWRILNEELHYCPWRTTNGRKMLYLCSRNQSGSLPGGGTEVQGGGKKTAKKRIAYCICAKKIVSLQRKRKIRIRRW